MVTFPLDVFKLLVIEVLITCEFVRVLYLDISRGMLIQSFLFCRSTVHSSAVVPCNRSTFALCENKKMVEDTSKGLRAAAENSGNQIRGVQPPPRVPGIRVQTIICTIM